jgi:hypothetical protein
VGAEVADSGIDGFELVFAVDEELFPVETVGDCVFVVGFEFLDLFE